jgi:hypothetical protein
MGDMTELANAPQDETNDWKVKPADTCEGCGSHHGGPTAEILCLRAWRAHWQARAERAELRLGHVESEVLELRAEVAPLRQLRAEVAATPRWKVPGT